MAEWLEIMGKYQLLNIPVSIAVSECRSPYEIQVLTFYNTSTLFARKVKISAKPWLSLHMPLF